MNCQEIRSLLSRYLEDDLDPDVKNLVEQHLGSCSGCARELDVLKGMISSLGKMEKVEPPFDFLESIHERLERPSKARLILRRMFYPPHIKLPIEAVVVAATILLVVRIVSFISPGKVMVVMKPAPEEEHKRLKVGVKEERMPVIDYEAAKEVVALKKPSVSTDEVEVEPVAGAVRRAAPREELRKAKAMFEARPQLPTITEKVAVQLANQFVVEQGYADERASLPADSLYFDEFEQGQQRAGESTEEILEARYNSIERVPVVTYEDEMSWNVVYIINELPGFGQVVNVDKNTAKVRMIPKKVALEYLKKK